MLFCYVITAEALIFTGAATKVSISDIFQRESGAQTLRRLSGFEGRIIFSQSYQCHEKFRQKYRHLKSTDDYGGYLSGISAAFLKRNGFFCIAVL